ncbi:GNAT family N-acetyltransferase [Brevibacillus porteri]|uniref:GNAT family N-acetyltransferase n=1 Tax=Brevibacillus porteri TaxID=2126350 RepID=UPI00370AF104
MFTVIRADQVEFDAREQMSQIFAEGFTQWLGFFSNDKQTIARAFAHMFVLNQFYVAVTDDRKVASMAACSGGTAPSVKLNPKELRKQLGFYKGTLAGLFLKKEFEATMADPSPVTCSIDFVGTAPEFRGQGAAMMILRHIMENTPLNNFSSKR